MKLRTLRDVERALHPYFMIAAETTGKDVTAMRTKQLLAALGGPQEKLRVIHLAGTSGKTSTAYYIATLLQKAGCTVGLTVSPHIDLLTERVQINGAPLPEKIFCAYMGDFLDEVKRTPYEPSWFELMICFSYWVFAKERVDYAVIETGLGGLHDATNVVERRDKLCVITDIGFDHMHILGNTLGAIAHQKAGIIHEGNVVLMYDQGPEVMQVVRYYVSQQEDAELLTFQQDRLHGALKADFVSHMPEYQKRNWLLAFAAYKYLTRRDAVTELSEDRYRASMTIEVPARMQTKVINGKVIILDGAHNAQKMQALVDSYTAEYGNMKTTVLLALKEGKEAADIAALVKDIADDVIVTRFEQSQDMPIKSQDPSALAAVFSDIGMKVTVEGDVDSAYEKALMVSDNILVTGSFYFIAQLRAMHKELQ
jgi:dihydrofolate synthase / folylpolyglutamate synthase